MRLLLISLTFSLTLTGSGPAFAAQEAVDEEDPVQTRGFSIPNTLGARALLQEVEEHLGARRWEDALNGLQSLLVDHAGDVLPGDKPRRYGRSSEQLVFPGAADYAFRVLCGMPADVREVYAARHRADAMSALARARSRADRGALAEVARRWPITPAAEQAWWSLGDLELESGNTALALSAWNRALRVRLLKPDLRVTENSDWAGLRSHLGEEGGAPEGLLARVELALELTGASDDRALGNGPPAQVHLPGPGEAAGVAPDRNADTWARPYDLREQHPFRNQRGQLYPVRAGDSILVSTSMELMSINAYTGRLQWVSGEAPGWETVATSRRDEYFEGVDRKGAMIVPAASQSIAVAALQIPITQIRSAMFQRITITTVIPDRRLFAFDLQDGRPLWNHMPSLTWDGESGSFRERMSVAGPPVIAGSRVLAPFYRMRGRIDYHVGCFDIGTGELLWSTDLISGQRELNMFGRHEKEFCAPPLRVEGDRVIALTNLGSIACLDLFSGEILWETLYEQIPLPKTRQWDATQRRTYWENCQPVVADGVVVATPLDSRDMIGVDLDSGTLLWTLSNQSVNSKVTGRTQVNHIDVLLGADRDVLYLGGTKLVALKAPQGLGRSRPEDVLWFFTDPVLSDGGEPPRAVVGRDRVVVSAGTQRIELDRFTGKRAAFPVPLHPRGNLLLGDGMLFALDGKQLNAYFEWNVLVDRARRRLEEQPMSRGRALELAGLLRERGRSEGQSGRTERAGSFLVEARQVLEPLLGSDETDAEIGRELHGVLLDEARVRADLAQTGQALRLLRQARDLAPTGEELLETLLEEEALLDRGGAERLALLDLMTESCGHLSLLCTWAADGQTLDGRDDEDLRPVLYGREGEQLPTPMLEVPVELWVLLERSQLHGDAGRYEAEFTDLHQVLYAYGDERLPGGRAYDVAGNRIARRLRANGGRGYESFEEQARAHLEEALKERDRELLEEVARLYPHSSAAESANDTLLQWALDSSDVATVARIVTSELTEPWQPATANEREIQLCLRLAGALAQSGSTEIASGILERLARHHGPLRSEVPDHGGRTITDLLSDYEARVARRGGPVPRASEEPEPAFRSRILPARAFNGRFDYLGECLPPERRAGRVRVFAADDKLVAFASDHQAGPAWEHQLAAGTTPSYWSNRFATTASRALIATRDAVVALDSATGEVAWEWSPVSEDLDAVAAGQGVVLAVLASEAGSQIQALDAHTGAALWSSRVPSGLVDPLPLIGDGRCVFLPKFGETTAVVRDLFTGLVSIEIELGWPPQRWAHETSWIEGGKLIIPRLREWRYPDRNHILAIDLESGRTLWNLSLDDDAHRYLDAVIHHGQETYLVLRPEPSSENGGRPGYLMQLHTDIGAKRRVGRLELTADDKLVDIDTKEITRLDEPFLFVLSPTSDNRETLVRAIHLPHGERWAYRLPISKEDLYPIRRPALSDSSVVFGYTRWPEKRSSRIYTDLVFLDRASGTRRGELRLSERFRGADEVQLLPLGPALLAAGSKRLEVLME